MTDHRSTRRQDYRFFFSRRGRQARSDVVSRCQNPGRARAVTVIYNVGVGLVDCFGWTRVGDKSRCRCPLLNCGTDRQRLLSPTLGMGVAPAGSWEGMTTSLTAASLALKGLCRSLFCVTMLSLTFFLLGGSGREVEAVFTSLVVVGLCSWCVLRWEVGVLGAGDLVWIVINLRNVVG